MDAPGRIAASEENQPLLQNTAEGTNDLQAAEGEYETFQNTTADQDSQDQEEEQDTVDETIGRLTRRLRCLFSAVTWPIVPLGILVILALVWLLYSAFIIEVGASCSRPLHEFAFGSMLLVIYSAYHAQIRAYLFRYSRDRDGPMRPAGVRLYDQIFHSICILYIYSGVSLVQSCRRDTGQADGAAQDKNATAMDDGDNHDSSVNSCQATCPVLYHAVDMYVTTLELFALSLLIPLILLPCIYLWILRSASGESALAELHDRLEEENFLGQSSSSTSVQELMDSLEPVQLKRGESGDVVMVSMADASSSDVPPQDAVKECCICMIEFPVTDVETPSPTDDDTMVRTKCGHVFHYKCIGGWVGGGWGPSARSRRRARRTCCPLCRADLRPSSS